MSQDIVVLLKIIVSRGKKWSVASLASELGLSYSQVHYAINRCLGARLLIPKDGAVEPMIGNSREFLLYAVKFICVSKRGEQTRGIPTMWAAPPLNEHIVNVGIPPVWPDAEGPMRGFAFEPIHKSAVVGSKKDPQLYEMLTLLDALRDGRAREKNLALEMLEERLKN